MEARGKMDLVESEPRTRYLTRDEEDALLRYASDTFRALFAFDIDTGLRRGELMDLAWRHVKLDIPNEDLIPARGHILVEKERTRTKGGSRVVPLVGRSYDYLKYAERKGLSVFCTAHGKPYSEKTQTRPRRRRAWGLSSNGTILPGKGWGMPVRARQRDAKTLPLTPQDREDDF